jgi:RimJ/RimL family protein N-acetyltransferase
MRRISDAAPVSFYTRFLRAIITPPKRINANEVIATARLRCHPYRKEMVPIYHSWMQDPWLRASTKSEILTLSEEYAVQAAVLDDDDRLTFIFHGDAASLSGAYAASSSALGEASLFMLDAHRARDDYWNGVGNGNVAEIMVMVGERSARRKGFAKETLIALLRYSALRRDVRGFVAKISNDNYASQALFKSIGFHIARVMVEKKEIHMIFEWKDKAAGLGEESDNDNDNFRILQTPVR